MSRTKLDKAAIGVRRSFGALARRYSMATVAVYFGSEAADAATRRRMRQLKGVGLHPIGFMFRRSRYKEKFVPDWENVDLGHLGDAQYLRRLPLIFMALARIWANRARLRGAKLVIARNLDMLAIAFLARQVGLFEAPIVYDVFDIRGVLLKKSIIARLLRWVEKRLLRSSDLLVVSSPGYLNSYFRPMLRYTGPSLVLENRIDLGLLSGDGETLQRWNSPTRTKAGLDGPIVLGWVGSLRCERSANMLKCIAEAVPEMRIQISGTPTFCSVEKFLGIYGGLSNVIYTGEYSYPSGLYEVYRSIDVNWCYDLSKDGVSGRWLLPNRLYEGGYFGVPQLAELGSETGHYVENLGIGWAKPAEVETLIEFFRDRIRAEYQMAKNTAVAKMNDTFHYSEDIRPLLDLINAASRAE